MTDNDPINILDPLYYLSTKNFKTQLLSQSRTDTTLMAESEEELKSLLMKVKVESEKVSLKLSIQKTKIMASSPITSWQIDGEMMETVRDFIWGGGIQNHYRW